MRKSFGVLPNGTEAFLYTISCGRITAAVTDYGAALVSLNVPGRDGKPADVILGYDNVNDYRTQGGCLGATVGRSANRLKDSRFSIGEKEYHMIPNENNNNLHSGPDTYFTRMWKAEKITENAITFFLHSPDGDQGFPGNADIRVCYRLDSEGGLHITYDGDCDQDTVFNMTNHSYFNLAGQDQPQAAMDQLLSMPARFFNPDDAESIPTGELRPVDGTPMDFRTAKPIGRDIGQNYDALNLQGGYDHNFEVWQNPCAILTDPVSGRTMSVTTDCPGVQFYSGNYLDNQGKDGVHYCKRSGIALETQFYPDALHHSDWPQPIVRAGKHYHSETVYRFSCL